METTDVIIVGGGLAGIRAAIDLVRRGFEVILFEKSPTLGGRAGSHQHTEFGWIDAGQHVYLGCCTHYIQLLNDLGSLSLAPREERLDLALIDGGHPPSQAR